MSGKDALPALPPLCMPAEIQFMATNADRMLAELRRCLNTAGENGSRVPAVTFHPQFPVSTDADPFCEGPGAVLREAELWREDTLAGDVARLKRLLLDLYARGAETGTIPPSPPTFRGRAGRLAIQAIHRVLWWQEGTLRRFAATVFRTSGWQTAILDRLIQEHDAHSQVLALLEGSVRSLQQELELARAENAELKETLRELGSRVQDATPPRQSGQSGSER